MTEYIVQDTSLTAVANKIREKTGDVAPLEFPDEFVAAIDSLIDLNNPPQAPSDSVLFYSVNPFSFYKKGSKVWSGVLEYSTDNLNWHEIEPETTYFAALNNSWYTLYIRGSNNTVISQSNGNRFVFRGPAKCVGNLNNLLKYNDTVTTISANAFNGLFYDCTTLDFDIELPATSVGLNSYTGMFEGCDSMTKAPALPATTLGQNCYKQMFSGCYSLVDVPSILPATNLQSHCYDAMFRYCALKVAPVLPATIMKTYSYTAMFADCTSLIEPPALPATTLDTYCYSSMFARCSSLEKLPALPATTLKSNCYYGTFVGCSKIKISETQVDEYTTSYSIPYSGTGTDATGSMTNMFNTTGGTFTGTPTINTPYYTSNTVISAT